MNEEEAKWIAELISDCGCDVRNVAVDGQVITYEQWEAVPPKKVRIIVAVLPV